MDSGFYFDLKKAAIFQAVKWGRYPLFRFAGSLKKIFSGLFIISLIIFLFGFLSGTFSLGLNKTLLSSIMISFALAVAFWLKEAFFNSKVKKPKIKIGMVEAIKEPEKFNLAEFLGFEAAIAVWKTLRFAESKKIAKISSSILFYFLITETPKLNFIFARITLHPKDLKKILEAHLKVLASQPENKQGSSSLNREANIKSEAIGLFSKDFQETIFEALKVAQAKNHQRITPGDLMVALSKHDLIFKKILIDTDIRPEDIKALARWQENLEERIAKQKRFWDYDNLLKRGTLAKEWAAGYTITLDKYAIDWTEVIKKQGFPEVIGHEKELKQMQRILARREINNVLLVGRPGTGRKSMVYALTCKSLLGQSLPEVNYKRIVELDLPDLLSQVESIDEVEAVLDKIFQETITAGNIILIIDEFHNFIGGKDRPGVIDISGILSSYLHLPQFQIVAITTYTGLHKYIEQKPSILNLFEKVEVPEISKEESMAILENLALTLERKYKRFITYPALREIIRLTDRYLSALPFPKKAMDILDETVIYVVNSTKDKVVTPRHVAKIITEKTQIPVGEITVQEKEVLLNLEDLIHKRIINQEEAVEEVSAALRRARTEVAIRKKPMGVFLFLGPTGVGKTETSKALAEIYFGSEEKMIRLDMSEFQNVENIPRLIGAPGEEGLLTTPVFENPFSIILLDEIEKAHSNILNLFLQVFDEGYLTDGWGRKIDFKNSIIIATSNAGAQIIWEDIRKDKQLGIIKEDLLSYLFEKAIFRPEFINRFDAVVVFRPLTEANLLDISQLMLGRIKNDLQNKGIEFIITEPLKKKIVELSYNPKFGAREMRRVIQDKVENVLAEALLSDKIKRGDRVEIEPEEFKLIIK